MMKKLKTMRQKQLEIVDEIFAERLRQDAKWGEQNHKPIEWLPILMEEVGEASKAALEEHFKEYYIDMSFQDYRKECIEVAAVALAMVECLDRGKWEPK